LKRQKLKVLLQGDTLQALKRLWREYIRFFLKPILWAMGFMILYAITNAALPALMKPVIDDVFTNKNIDKLEWVSIAVLVIFFLKSIAFYGEMVTMNYVGQSIITRIQKQVFRHLLTLDMAFYYKQTTGRLVSMGTYHISVIKNMIANILTVVGKDFFSIIGLVGLMFYQDPFLSLIATVILPIAIIPLANLGRRMRRIANNTQDLTGDWTSFMTQVFQGIRIVKSYNMEHHEMTRAQETMDRLLQLSLKAGKTRFLSSPIMEALGGIAVVVIIVYGGLQVINGQNTAGAFFSFIAALMLCYAPMKRLAFFSGFLQEGLAAVMEIFQILDTKPTIVSPPNCKPLAITKGALSLQDLSFAYEEKLVLKDISLDIPAGKKVALVGPSGAGKTTLFNLLLRFFDPTSGSITIDGQDIRRVDLASLRSAIGMVSQEVTLFDDTIEENIRYGRPGATFAEVEAAARGAYAHDFIQELPQGYQTMVGEMGLKLSGGQRQRISIARAFLKNAPILLLDEATSALDTESEKMVQEALKALMQGKTCVVIAHRLSTVKDADIIYVMQSGQIVESGGHASLLKQDGVYKQLCQSQLMHDA